MAVYTQTITVTDNTRPTWTTAAGNLDRTVECSDAPALTAAQALTPVATDNCDITLTPVKTAGAFVAGTCPQAGTYTNTWTVSDDCGNAVVAVYTQTITVTDNTRPHGRRQQVTLTARSSNAVAVYTQTITVTDNRPTWTTAAGNLTARSSAVMRQP